MWSHKGISFVTQKPNICIHGTLWRCIWSLIHMVISDRQFTMSSNVSHLLMFIFFDIDGPPFPIHSYVVDLGP